MKGIFKKDYFTSQEQLEIMMALCLKQNLSEMIDSWEKRKAIDTTEAKNLKLSRTYLTKFLQSLFNRTNKKELDKLNRKMKVNTVRLYDKFQLDQLNREIDGAYARTTLDSEQYCTFCEEIMDVRCNGCDKDWKTCDLYNLFDSTLAPEPGCNKANCKYSYDK